MTIKSALFYTFSIGALCVFLTWFIGHLWVFIILVTAVLIGIAVSLFQDSKKTGRGSDSDHKK